MARELQPINPNPPRPSTTTPRMYAGSGSIKGATFEPSTGLFDPDTIRGNSVAFTANSDRSEIDKWIEQFEKLLYDWYADLDPADFEDDMDRIERAEEANRLKNLLDAYNSGAISREKFLDEFNTGDTFDEIPGFDDWFNEVRTNVSGEGTEGESELTEAEIAEQAAAISDEDALKTIYENLPDPLKKVISSVKRDPLKVVKDIADLIIDDPMTRIKKEMVIGADISAILKGGNWRDIKVFGPFIIPGLPLPPGIIEATIGDIIKSAEGMGKKIEDFIGGVLDGSIWGEIGEWIEGVFTNDDPENSIFGGTLGGFEDYVKGVLGGVVGGSILVDIYDEVKGWFEDTGVPPIPGGDKEEDPEPEKEPTPKQGDDIADFETDFESEEELEFDGFDSVDDDTTDDISLGIDLSDPEPYDPDIYVPDETGGPIELGGDDDDDDQTGGLDGIDLSDQEPYDPDIYIPGYDDDDDDDPDEPGGPLSSPDEEDDPDQPGSTTDSSSSSSSGGGGGGGGAGDAGPFMRGIEYVVPAVPGLLTTPNIDYAKGLIQPPDSKGNLDMLIQRLQDRMLT